MQFQFVDLHNCFKYLQIPIHGRVLSQGHHSCWSIMKEKEKWYNPRLCNRVRRRRTEKKKSVKCSHVQEVCMKFLNFSLSDKDLQFLPGCSVVHTLASSLPSMIFSESSYSLATPHLYPTHYNLILSDQPAHNERKVCVVLIFEGKG